MLFCKPSTKSGTLIELPFDAGQTIRLRSLDLKKDLNILHQWVNSSHARRFWQLEGTLDQLRSTYQPVLRNSDSHSFILLLDEQLICQVDCYRVEADELGKYISCHYHDSGVHLLMAPSQTPVPGLTRAVMETFLRYYFSFDEAQHLYAEPDIYNHKACQLLTKCGFGFVQNIMLSTKAASLYLMTKKQFHATYTLS
jgi:hypothetical protein